MREGARLLRPVGEEQEGRNIASRRVCPPISGSVGVEPSPSPRSETKASLGLSQGHALILVLVLSSVLCAAIWATVALLSVAGGVNWGELMADG
jgi:hypothetical protein